MTDNHHDLEAKYGLPGEVRFCRSCVISNQRPNSTIEYKHTPESKKQTIHFDESGECDACRVTKKKKNIDWNERERELIELCDRHRSSDGSYDCLIPGSGGKDSFYQSHILKYRYGMNPLTVTWAPHEYTSWGWRNFQAWIASGFDNFLCTPNKRVHRLLTRLAVQNLFHPFQPFMLGQKFLGPRMAALHGIKLVFFGENEAEYGNPIADIETSKRDHAYYCASDESDIYYSGISVAELKDRFGLSENDFELYRPIDPNVLEEKGVEVHYLGYYLKWHPQSCYYYAVEHGDFEASPERTPGTYSKYNSIDDKIDDLHYWTTFIKFGIGRATYDASQEIRSGDITREEGVALVRRFDGEWPDRFENDLMNYLSVRKEELPRAFEMLEQPTMTRDYFLELADAFRSPHLWRKDGDAWVLRHAVWHEDTGNGA